MPVLSSVSHHTSSVCTKMKTSKTEWYNSIQEEEVEAKWEEGAFSLHTWWSQSCKLIAWPRAIRSLSARCSRRARAELAHFTGALSLNDVHFLCQLLHHDRVITQCTACWRDDTGFKCFHHKILNSLEIHFRTRNFISFSIRIWIL